jgi:23S rRNA pseudouridine2605 synthase
MTTSAGTTATTPESNPGERLQKFLAAAGIASRREAERLIQGGHIEVNGHTVTTLGTRIDPGRDTVRIDGRRVRRPEQRVHYLLYKPPGYITSVRDPQGRPTVLQLLRGVHERVFPVGRLDWESEGLLILTNDGDLAHRLTHPAGHVPKVYRVKVKGMIGPGVLRALRRGIFVDGRKCLPARATRVSGQSNTWVEVTLYEGRKNQIRRMFDVLGHPVLKLRRIAIGTLRDRDLKPGEFRRITSVELRRLRGQK